MDLLFFFQSGLWRSSRRWKFAFNRNVMFLFWVVVVYVFMFFSELPLWFWLVPIACYLLALLVTLVVPNDEMTIGCGRRKAKFLVFALKDSAFGVVRDGVFVRTRGCRVFDIFPVSLYRRRFGNTPMMLVEKKDTKCCYVYSHNYPMGLYLGYAWDDDMVIFRDNVFQQTFVVVPGEIFRLFNVKSVTQGAVLYSDFWSKAAYFRADTVSENEKLDETAFKDLLYRYQVDVKHFLLLEFQDNWFKLFFVLINKDNVVGVLDVRDVDVVSFETDNDQKIVLQYDADRRMYSLAE